LFELGGGYLSASNNIEFRSHTFLQDVVRKGLLLVGRSLEDLLETLEGHLHDVVLFSLIGLEDDGDHLGPNLNGFEIKVSRELVSVLLVKLFDLGFVSRRSCQILVSLHLLSEPRAHVLFGQDLSQQRKARAEKFGVSLVVGVDLVVVSEILVVENLWSVLCLEVLLYLCISRLSMFFDHLFEFFFALNSLL